MKRRAIILLFLAFGAAFAVIAFATRREPERFLCGHQDPWWLSKPDYTVRGREPCRFDSNCPSERMVEYVTFGMRIHLFYYLLQHERLPKDLNQLAPYEDKSRQAEYSELKKFVAYQPEGTNWQARVAPNGRFAGHYLVNQSGAVYFHRWRPPTTNDICLKPPAN